MPHNTPNQNHLSQGELPAGFTAVRVRFAPSPTGFMHLGNVRTAVLNYLFAKQKQGTFVLRIEDTDAERNFDVGAQQILADLAWLGLAYDEGPFFQSQRADEYQTALQTLIAKEQVYRCFCSSWELEQKRALQIALHLAPRYDRTCAKLTAAELQTKLAQNTPFIWRFRVDQTQQVGFTDLAKGQLNFDLKHFSDFPLTRQDQSFTFIFANLVDDILMQISHVLRGEDHLTNTVNQILLYQAFEKPVPLFWHLPLICNSEGKKLSKRDFGFSLVDLQKAGFLPQAITNYLGILGASFAEEILPLATLAQTANFDQIHSASQIKYDVKKLEWLNHKWIGRLSVPELVTLCQPYLNAAYPEQIANLTPELLTKFVQLVHTDLVKLSDIVPQTKFYFTRPDFTVTPLALTAELRQLLQKFSTSLVDAIAVVPAHSQTLNHTAVSSAITTQQTPVPTTAVPGALDRQPAPVLVSPTELLTELQVAARALNIPAKIYFPTLRTILTGQPTGPHLPEIIAILGYPETQARLQLALAAQP